MSGSTEWRVAVVTGASQGIGGAIAVQLATKGYRLGLAARSRAKLEAVARACAEARLCTADLRSAAACSQVIDDVIETFGRLDLLVNCAGAAKLGDFLSLSEDDFLDGFALKFHGAVSLTRAAWPHLTRSGKGHVINIIGIGSRTPLADNTISGPVNSALLSFTKAMADRGVKDGVRVNGINPGFIDTARVGVWVARIAERDGIGEEEVRGRLVEEQRILRVGRPEEVAALVAFLDSADGQYFHGAILDIDGGATKST